MGSVSFDRERLLTHTSHHTEGSNFSSRRLHIRGLRPASEYASEFVEFLRNEEFFCYFPEYRGTPVVPVFSSLYLSSDLVAYLTRQSVYAVAMGDEAMGVLNLEQVRSKRS